MGVMDQQKGKAASQPKRGVQVIDPVLKRPDPSARPKPRLQRPPRPPQPSAQWPLPMDEDLTPPPAAKRARTGDMPPVPVRARFPLPGVAPPEPEPILQPRKTSNSERLKRPSARSANGPPAAGANGASSNGGLERLEQEVLGGRLWHAACRDLNEDLPESVPLSFPDAAAYVGCFEPLLFEEARECIRSDWAEACEAFKPRTWPALISSMEDRAGGWTDVTVTPQPGGWDLLRPPQQGSLVILTSQQPPARQALDWLTRSQRDRGHSRDSPDPPFGAGAGHRSRSPSPFSGGAPPGTSTADFQRQQMAEGLDGLEPAGPRAAATAAASGPPHNAPKPQNTKAATEHARSVDSGSAAAAAAEGDRAMVENDTEEGEVGTVKASSGNVSGKVEGSSNGGPVLQNEGKRRRGREQSQARGYASRTASPEPSGWKAGNGRADGAMQASSVPSVIAGVVKSTSYRQDGGAGTFVISVHPCCSAHHSDACDGPCTKALEELRKKPSGWWGVLLTPLVTQTREYHTIHNLSNMPLVTSILHPERLKAIGESTLTMDAIRTLWPPELSGPKAPKFIDFLKHQYDHSQLEAIEMAACHLGPSAKEGSPQEGLPFLLIQGPPGTGKTHTVKGVLNVWHLTHFVRHYEATAAALFADAKAGATMDAMHGASDHRGKAGGKPRILICAPSNAAADELLQRIMDTGFRDANGGVYRPDVVRVGAEEAPLSQRARDVWVDGLIRKLMGLSREEWRREFEQRRQEAMHLALRIREAQKHIRAADASQADVQKWGHDLASTHDAHHRAMLALKRLEEVQGLFSRTSSPKEVESNLELSFVEEAEMVFTTLSSTGRRIFQRLERTPFHTVLIDEAAQASEIAALQPLVFGAKRAVLVGDPQQLPATVKSAKGKELELERSLFERLQRAGCPVKLLSVQYRMHPAIRQFPSDYFYGGRLEDGKSVREAVPPVFYEHPLLKPYNIFDVSSGREQRGGSNGGSLRNQAEADLAAALYIELMAFRAACERRGAKLGACEVGIVTPYKQQKLCLRETFLRAAGPEASSKVMIETVDSFQGKQLDVIILSCVRASDRRSGVGFLADVRRMNVAITRAKQALWVLGAAATLERNPVWAALLANARERGCVVSEASARRLFPDQKPYKPPMSIPTQAAAAAGVQQQQHGSQVPIEPSSQVAGQPQRPADAAQLQPEEGTAVHYMDLQPADILPPHVMQLNSVSGQPANPSSTQPADPRLRQQQQQQHQAGSAGEQIQPAAEAQLPVDPRLKQHAAVPSEAQAQPALAVQQTHGPSDPRQQQQQQHVHSTEHQSQSGMGAAQMVSDSRVKRSQHQLMGSAEGQPQPAADLQSAQGQGQPDPRLRQSKQQQVIAGEGQQGPEAPMLSNTQVQQPLPQQQRVQPPSHLADPRLAQPHRAVSQAATARLRAPADPRALPAAAPPDSLDPRLRPNQVPVDPCAQPQRPSPITLQPPVASSGRGVTAGQVHSDPPEQMPVDYGRSGSAAENSHSGHTSQAPADPRIQRQLPNPITLQPPTSNGAQSSGGHVQGGPGPPPITLQPPASSAGLHFSNAHGPAAPLITLQPPTSSGGAHSNAAHVAGPLPITLQPPSSMSSKSGSAHALPGPPPITLQPPGGLADPSERGGTAPGARPRPVTLRPPPMHAAHTAAQGVGMQQSGNALHRNANGSMPTQRGPALLGNGSVVRDAIEGNNGHQQGRVPKPITLRPPQQEQHFQAHTFQYKR